MRPFHVTSAHGEVVFRVNEDDTIYTRPGLTVDEAVDFALAALTMQRDTMMEQQQLITLLQSNRWADAVCDGVAVYNALTPAARKTISTRMVTQVLDAVAVVARKSIN